MRSHGSTRVAACVFLLGVAAATAVRAQTGVDLVLKPGPKDAALEVEARGLLFDQGYTRGTDLDFRLSILESEGRWRFKPDMQLSPAVGYSLNWIEIDADGRGLPDRLVDASLAVGSALAQSGEWWFAGLAGVGYAGDKPLADADAWYLRVDLIVGRNLWDGILVAVLDYDGNRSVFPDIPLPGIAYSSKISEQLLYVVGVPISSVTWKPSKELRVDVTWTIPSALDVLARYEIGVGISIYGRYDDRTSAFDLDGTSDTQRLFFLQRRAEAGLHWSPNAKFGVVLGVGLAFSQELASGFDKRDLDKVAKISDEPFVRIGVEWRP